MPKNPYIQELKDMEAELQKRFTYHPPKDDQARRYELLRAEGKILAGLIVVNSPASREQSLALTKLEEALFWSNAAIARNE